jgi:formylglycine-generating enzyme required for sulfatase activity
MSNHPVVEVSWYGATAFCNYYGYRLPTEWEWQTVADYDGSYIYGCGLTIDHSKANYDRDNPLGLSSEPYTSPVNHYSSYGYGLKGMTGNAMEWTSSCYYAGCSPDDRVIRGGSWTRDEDECTVSYQSNKSRADTRSYIGFRVCR